MTRRRDESSLTGLQPGDGCTSQIMSFPRGVRDTSKSGLSSRPPQGWHPCLCRQNQNTSRRPSKNAADRSGQTRCCVRPKGSAFRSRETVRAHVRAPIVSSPSRRPCFAAIPSKPADSMRTQCDRGALIEVGDFARNAYRCGAYRHVSLLTPVDDAGSLVARPGRRTFDRGQSGRKADENERRERPQTGNGRISDYAVWLSKTCAHKRPLRREQTGAGDAWPWTPSRGVWNHIEKGPGKRSRSTLQPCGRINDDARRRSDDGRLKWT